MYMYVYIRTCISIYTYIHVHTYIYIYMHIYTVYTRSGSQRITADHFVDEIEINDYPQTARYKVPSEYPVSTRSTPVSTLARCEQRLRADRAPRQQP